MKTYEDKLGELKKLGLTQAGRMVAASRISQAFAQTMQQPK